MRAQHLVEWADVLPTLLPREGQDPLLIGVVHLDDACLLRNPHALWFHVLLKHDWTQYREIECGYYNALRAFNKRSAEEAIVRKQTRPPNPETKDAAKIRLLFERPTMGNADAPILHPEAAPRTATYLPSPSVAGRAPKDFYALLRAFVGVTLMGREPEPEMVHKELTNNPAFARAAGFTSTHPSGVYRQSDIPSLRKIEQFDQIMTDNGLWKAVKLLEIKRNIDTGVIEREQIVVHDTTHLHAHSSFETIRCDTEQGKAVKKSAPKPTKHCGCKDKHSCPHPWESGDLGAATVTKAGGKRHWAHKASVMSLPRQGVALDAFAVTDAATHDGRTVIPSLDRLYRDHPYFKDWFTTLLDDGAADDSTLKQLLREKYDLRLICSLNPRGRKVVTEGLGRGILEIRPNGDVICLEGASFDYRGIRFDHEMFNFGPPLSEEGVAVCPTCPQKQQCCPNAKLGRHLAIPFEMLPQIDPADPQLAKRFKAMLARRTAIERTIKSIKCDLGGDTLTKRGNVAFQARLDKTLIAYHILLRY